MADANGTARAGADASWEAYILLAAVLALAIALAWLADRIVMAVVRRGVRRTRTDLDDVLVEAIHRPLVATLSIAGILVLLREARVRARVPADAIATIERFQVAILMLAVAYAIVRVTRALLQRPGTRFARVRSVGNLVGRLVAVAVYTVAGLMVLDQYGLSITPVLTSLGIAGLAVALALQDTLANFFAGMWIQTGRALRPGHTVRIEDLKLEGTIADVGWRTTMIRTSSNALVVVPNAKFAQAVVTDLTLPDPPVSSTITVTAGFEADPAHVERVLLAEVEAARAEHPVITAEPPLVRLTAILDFGLQFTLIFTVASYNDQFGVQDTLRRRALTAFRREGIRIPYPTREVLQREVAS